MERFNQLLLGLFCILTCTARVCADATVTVTVSEPASTSPTAIATTSSSAALVDTDAGASGTTESSIGLSKGGLIAIVVVVVVVAIFGIVSTVLFVVAKRRQWDIRASIARASRRLTGRAAAPKAYGASDRRSRRPVFIDATAGRSGVKAVHTPGQKRPLVVEVKDIEKGNDSNPRDEYQGKDTKSTAGDWVHKLRGNDWK